MVNAAIKGDPSMALGGASTVAKTMVNYVSTFAHVAIVQITFERR
jgi:hypothetical protein